MQGRRSIDDGRLGNEKSSPGSIPANSFTSEGRPYYSWCILLAACDFTLDFTLALLLLLLLPLPPFGRVKVVLAMSKAGAAAVSWGRLCARTCGTAAKPEAVTQVRAHN